MLYFRRVSDGAWLGVSIGNPPLSIDAHASEVGEQYGFEVEGIAANDDPRSGELLLAPIDALPPVPGDLLLAIFATLGKPKARALARAYPDAMLAIDHHNWAVLRAAVDDMLADTAVTQEQYDGILALFASQGVPEA